MVGRPWLIRGTALLLVTAAIFGVAAVVYRPQPVWLIDPEFTDGWQRLIAAAPDAQTWPVVVYDRTSEAELLARRFGFFVGTSVPQFHRSADHDETITVHQQLSRSLQTRNVVPLSIDPWLVFRRHSTPPLSRERVDVGTTVQSPLATAETWSGTVLLPGSDPGALDAWTAQLLQEAPGRFSDDRERWDAVRDRLIRGGGFQRGALTYHWEDIWPRLFGPEPVWVYAPLSRVQELPGDRTSLLEADRFPIPDHWNEYGVQARILWAAPFGMQHRLFGSRIERELANAREWLGTPQVQTLIATQVRWVPAHRQARPLTPLAAAAHRAWIGSSYVWEYIARETNN